MIDNVVKRKWMETECWGWLVAVYQISSPVTGLKRDEMHEESRFRLIQYLQYVGSHLQVTTLTPRLDNTEVTL